MRKLLTAGIVLMAALSMNMTSFASTGWNYDTNGRWYSDSQGNYTKANWQYINGDWYYFNESGYAATGVQSINGQSYNFDSVGKLKVGWFPHDGVYSYQRSDGSKQTGWFNEGGRWHLLDNNGSLLVGWQQVGSYWYNLGDDGKMNTSWFTDKDGCKYFLNSDGAMLTGVHDIDGKTYLFGGNGVLVNPNVSDINTQVANVITSSIRDQMTWSEITALADVSYRVYENNIREAMHYTNDFRNKQGSSRIILDEDFTKAALAHSIAMVSYKDFNIDIKNTFLIKDWLHAAKLYGINADACAISRGNNIAECVAYFNNDKDARVVCEKTWIECGIGVTRNNVDGQIYMTIIMKDSKEPEEKSSDND